MRPRSSSEYPFTPPPDEPEVHVTVSRPHALAFTNKTPPPAPASTPPSTTIRPFDDGRAALVADLDRLRARAEALALTPELARRLGGDRAGDALAAIASIRRAVEESSERIARALALERVPTTRRRVAG